MNAQTPIPRPEPKTLNPRAACQKHVVCGLLLSVGFFEVTTNPKTRQSQNRNCTGIKECDHTGPAAGVDFACESAPAVQRADDCQELARYFETRPSSREVTWARIDDFDRNHAKSKCMPACSFGYSLCMNRSGTCPDALLETNPGDSRDLLGEPARSTRTDSNANLLGPPAVFIHPKF